MPRPLGSVTQVKADIPARSGDPRLVIPRKIQKAFFRKWIAALCEASAAFGLLFQIFGGHGS
jgi:hypothetical protein